MPDKRRIPPKPPQPPLPGTEEPAPKAPSLLRRILTKAGVALLILLALAFAYVFLLLGEPDEESKLAAPAAEDAITLPMSPLDIPGQANVAGLAETFGQPVLALNSGAEMHKARIYDTAFEGGYARRITLTYTLEDGTQFTLESMRPTSSATLLKQDGYRLDATALYALGGMNAARMENDLTICVFAQSDAAVYAVICPKTHEEELKALIRQTMLIEPETKE